MVSSEASNGVNKALVVLEAVDSACVQNFSAKLNVGADVGLLRSLSAKVELKGLSQGSRPADHGSIVSLSTRRGGAVRGLMYSTPSVAS